jgi:hypothetical protein
MGRTSLMQRIEIPFPEAAAPELILRTGPCALRLSPSDGDTWIDGTYLDSTNTLPLQVSTGNPAVIAQGFHPFDFAQAALPQLTLALSRRRPFALELQSGASDMNVDLGGLPLSRLLVKAGAGRLAIDFGATNPTAMTLMELSAGAGAFSATHLANAGFAALRVGTGVAACALTFDGELARDASVRIDAGLGSVDLFIPTKLAAIVRAKAVAASRHVSDAFVRDGDTYSTPAAVHGAHPLLDIDVSIAFGALTLATV